MPENCPYVETIQSHNHPYLIGCTLPSEHGGWHELEPAHRIMWERVHGVPAPARVAHLTPKDNDWTNLEPDNWHVVSLSSSRIHQAKIRSEEGEKKHCKECEQYLPLSAFEKKRSVCLECRRAKALSNINSRTKHNAEFNCRLLNGVHYHLTDAASVKAYWWHQWFQETHKQYPDESRYHLAVAHMRARLRSAVKSSHGGINV